MHISAADLDHIMAHTRGLWEQLRGKSVFITGGTGFFGTWLLESFVHANQALELNARAVVLTRDPEAFSRKAPHLVSDAAVLLHRGDICSFAFPTGCFSHVIHAATEASVRLNLEDPLRMTEVIVDGTRRVLEFAARARTRRLLFTSSGAVYGRQPPEMSHVVEDYTGAPDPTDRGSAYGEGKRLAEYLCVASAHRDRYDAVIARCFAFVGPHLSLDTHFAIGNFIRDALRGGPIRITGDGTPHRSYLYAADLAVWLWTMLFRAPGARPYNVGSDESISIVGLARAVSDVLGGQAAVEVAERPTAGRPAARYVPSVNRAETELGLNVNIPLAEAIRRTADWHGFQRAG